VYFNCVQFPECPNEGQKGQRATGKSLKSGEGGACRSFSKPPPSASRPPLRRLVFDSLTCLPQFICWTTAGLFSSTSTVACIHCIASSTVGSKAWCWMPVTLLHWGNGDRETLEGT
jgi:hypothetical protein